MRIAVDTTALDTGYRIQGTGNYIKHLTEGLQALKDKNEYFFYKAGKKIPQIDLVHIPYFSAYRRVLPIRKTSKKLVLTIHDLIPVVFDDFFPPDFKGLVSWYLQQFLLKHKVDHIIADSEATKNDILNCLNLNEDKVTVVYLAADSIFKPLNINQRDLHKELRQKYNLPEEFVLYVGDVLWSKNIPSLIEAIQAINVTLVLVGKQFTNHEVDKTNFWNKDLIRVQKMIVDDKRIIPLSYIDEQDLVKLYNMAAVYCQPSHYEGFGLPVLEAMACGCPVVVSRKGSLPEVVGDAGIYIDSSDARNIADGIGEIYFNSDNYKKYRQLGLTQAKKFNWEKTIAETIKVYNKVL